MIGNRLAGRSFHYLIGGNGSVERTRDQSRRATNGKLRFYVIELQKRHSRMELNASRSELYRQRALEVRQTAARIEQPDVKEEYEKIAREYEALAKALDLGLLAR